MSQNHDGSLNLARIKLTELRRQRTQLDVHYSELEAMLGDGSIAPMDRLRQLVAGLHQARFAQTPLHPRVGNMPTHLSVLESEAVHGSPSGPLITQWIEHLHEELQQGRTRVAFAHLFGQLVEEHLADGVAPPLEEPPLSEWPAMFSAWEGAIAADDFSPITEAIPEATKALRKAVEALNTQTSAAARQEEVQALLRDATRSPSLSGASRREARAALTNATRRKEYTDVLTILLERMDGWAWPEETQLVSSWKRGRARPTVRADLLNHLFVELIGLRWGIALKTTVRKILKDGALYPQRAEAPKGTTDEELRELFEHTVAENQRVNHQAAQSERVFIQIPGTLDEVGTRPLDDGSYGSRERSEASSDGKPRRWAASGLDRVLQRVCRLASGHGALFPNRPRWVLSVDLEQFFYTIPHEVLLAMMEHLGLDTRGLSLLKRMLAVQGTLHGERRAVQRGVVGNPLISWVLSELLLVLLDAQVFATSGLMTLRMVDDVALVAEDGEALVAAWEAIQSFCATMGLRPNHAKCGTVSLTGDDLPPGLPTALPRWGLLRLHPDGVWRIDHDAVAAFTTWLNGELRRQPSILSMVRTYNAEQMYMIVQLGLGVWQGEEHFQAVGDALTALHQGVLNGGIEEAILQRAETRLGGPMFQGQKIPGPLLYWPITAGGLGLRHPLIPLISARRGHYPTPDVPKPPTAERMTQLRAYTHNTETYIRNEWTQHASRCTSWVRDLHPLTEERSPPEDDTLRRLLDDFVERGSEVSGRTQHGLSPYWRWVVYTYGPLLLKTVGTFRFLLTELVPLSLVIGPQSGQPPASRPPIPVPEPTTIDDDIPF